MTLMNSFGEFVDAEPPCAYPRIAALNAYTLIPHNDKDRMVGFGRFEVECSECGTKFRTNSNQQRTCCAACGRIRKARLQKEKREAEKRMREAS